MMNNMTLFGLFFPTLFYIIIINNKWIKTYKTLWQAQDYSNGLGLTGESSWAAAKACATFSSRLLVLVVVAAGAGGRSDDGTAGGEDIARDEFVVIAAAAAVTESASKGLLDSYLTGL